MKIVVTTNPGLTDADNIMAETQGSNVIFIGENESDRDLKFAVLAIDDDNRRVGEICVTAYGCWLTIEKLWLDESIFESELRLLLLEKAEGFAMENDFFHLRLDTICFKERAFYLQQGYEISLELDDLVLGSTSYLMQKTLIC